MDQQISKIVTLAREAHGKKVSELTDLQKHAVAFTCSYFPAEIVNGKLKYSKNAKKADLSVEFVLINSMITTLNSGDKRFTSASVHVWPDEELPKYQAVPWKAALQSYPDTLKIPDNKYEGSIHLEKIQYPMTQAFSKDDILHTVAMELIQLEAYGRNPNLEISRKHKILCYTITKNMDSARKIESLLKLNFLSWMSMHEWKPVKLTYSEEYNPEDYCNQSYLAAFIYAQSKDLYIKYYTKEDI